MDVRDAAGKDRHHPKSCYRLTGSPHWQRAVETRKWQHRRRPSQNHLAPRGYCENGWTHHRDRDPRDPSAVRPRSGKDRAWQDNYRGCCPAETLCSVVASEPMYDSILMAIAAALVFI